MLQKCMVPVQTETIEDPATEPLKTFISLISLEVGGRTGQLHYHLQTIGLPSFTYIPMLSVMFKPSLEKSEGKIRRALFHSVNFNLVYNQNMENWSYDIG